MFGHCSVKLQNDERSAATVADSSNAAGLIILYRLATILEFISLDAKRFCISRATVLTVARLAYHLATILKLINLGVSRLGNKKTVLEKSFTNR
jgi:hypothetical protein